MKISSVLALVLPALVACGGAPPAAQAPAAPAAWKDMNHGQRGEYMKEVVTPKMHADFAAYDTKRFGDINCKTCHGKGVDDKSFKMPNAELPKLPATPEGFGKLAEEKPAAMKFMVEIEHAMAKLVGEEPYDKKTGKGFGCFECHTK